MKRFPYEIVLISVFLGETKKNVMSRHLIFYVIYFLIFVLPWILNIKFIIISCPYFIKHCVVLRRIILYQSCIKVVSVPVSWIYEFQYQKQIFRKHLAPNLTKQWGVFSAGYLLLHINR